MEYVPRPMVPLVGRRSELATLTATLDGVLAGESATILLSGDAGVGKTRLLSELLDHATRKEMITLVGHCIDFGDAGLPYLPFSEVFGRFAADRPDLLSELLDSFPPISRLLPNRRLLGAQPDVPDDRLDWSQLYDAVLGALTTLAERQPVLLVIEDVHWADESTRDLIGFLLTRLRNERIALVVSYRSDDLHRRHPLRRVVAEWSRLPQLRRMHLPPLTADGIRRLVRALHPAPLPEKQMRRIIDLAEGNAFFAEELTAAVGALDGGQVPAELADVLLVRLDRLSEQARHVIRVASVAGRRVSHSLLAVVADIPDVTLDEALREAVEQHVLEPTSGGGYGFRHALLAEAVYDDLLPGERVRIHAAYAAALAKNEVDGTPAELARHARASHDLRTAYQASIRAGDEAMQVAAPQEAMRHYETALELIDQSDDVSQDCVRIPLAAAEAAYTAGHPFRALNLVQKTLAELPEGTDATTRAELLYAFATYALTIETDVDAFAASAEALRLVPKERSELRARIAALHARTAMALGRNDEATRWAEEAVEAAVELNIPRVSADAMTTLVLLEERAGDPPAALARMEQVAEEARQTGEITVELRSLYNLASLHYERGDFENSIKVFRIAVERARQTGRQWAAYGLDSRTILGVVQFARGDWDDVLVTANVDGESPPAMAEAALAAVALQVQAGRGERAALDKLPLLRSWWQRDGWIAITALTSAVDLYSHAGRLDAGLDAADELISLITDLWQQPRFAARIRLSALALGALCAATPGLSQAERVHAVQRGQNYYREGQATVDAIEGEGGEDSKMQRRKLGPEGSAWVARLDAEWARLRWLADVNPPTADELNALWQRAVDAFGYGHAFEQARSRARLAAVLKATGQPNEATEQASLASEVATRLGSEPLLDELRAVGVAAVPAAANGASALTSREREVLGLLIEGRTNRQVARQLYISEKTVSVHVSNILAKLGVRNRSEAAAVARRDALIG